MCPLFWLGCGDDAGGGGGSGGRDAAPTDGSVTGDAGDFTTPNGFDHTGCEMGWDQLALDGTIWSIDHNLQVVGQFAGIVRFDLKTGSLAATYNGGPTASTVQTARDLFWYRAAQGRLTPRSFLACTRPAPGVIDGKMEGCNRMGDCAVGTFHAVKLERRAGEGEKSSNVTFLGEYGGNGTWPTITANVRVDLTRQLAVLARYDDGLRILRLTPGTPYTIAEISHVDTEDAGSSSVFEIYNDVKLIDRNGRNYALMASSTHGIVVFDITDPTQPMRKSHIRDGDNVHTHFIVGTTVYMADLAIGGIVIADISNPEQPVELGQYVLPNGTGAVFVHDLFVEPGRAYLDYWGAGLVVVDVTNPAMPQLLGQFTYPRMTNHSNWVTTIHGRKIALTGDEDFTAHGRELDVTDPANIRLVGEWGQDRPQVSIHNILCDGDKAYVAHYMDGLRILQLSDTAAPTQIGYYNTWSPSPNTGFSFFEGAIGIDKIGNIAYLAEEERGLIILQVP